MKPLQGMVGGLFILLMAFSWSAESALALPDTGITKCYDGTGTEIVCPEAGQDFYGQDANYGPGLLSFTDNGNGTVSDRETGLMWEVKSRADGVENPADPNDADNTYFWTEAASFISDLNSTGYGGYSDWRLPTVQELDAITDLSRENPAIEQSSFPNCRAGRYWSADLSAADPNQAWAVDFGSGADGYADQANTFYLRAVR